MAAQQSAPGNPLNDLLVMQMNWDAYKSDDNAKPSAHLKFVPYETRKQDGNTFTSYYLYAVGLPQDKPYTLIVWQIGWDAQQPPMQPSQSGLYVNARGVVMCRKPAGKEVDSDAPETDSDARLNVISAGAIGEPVRYALYAKKDGIVAMGRLVVNPLQSEDKGCRLQVIRALGGAEVVLVEGTGFAPSTNVQLARSIGGKDQTAKFKTDSNGRIETAAILFSPDRMQGSGTLSMKADSCSPSVNVSWGHDTYKVQ